MMATCAVRHHSAQHTHQRTACQHSNRAHQCAHAVMPPCAWATGLSCSAAGMLERQHRVLSSSECQGESCMISALVHNCRQGCVPAPQPWPKLHGIAVPPADELLDRVVLGLVHLEQLPAGRLRVAPGPSRGPNDGRACGGHPVCSGPANPGGCSSDEDNLAAEILHAHISYTI